MFSRIFLKVAFSSNSTDDAVTRHVCMFVHSMRLPLSQPAFVHAILFSTISKTRSLKVSAETPTGSCHILSFRPPLIAFFFPCNTPACIESISHSIISYNSCHEIYYLSRRLKNHTQNNFIQKIKLIDSIET